MANENKLFWLDKKSVFGSGKNVIQFGDQIKPGTIDAGRLVKLKKAGSIGELKVTAEVTNDDKLKAKLEKAEKTIAERDEKIKDLEANVEKLNQDLEKAVKAAK